jgi:isoleucyl-tRNA synthetase
LESIGSRAELVEKAIEDIDESIELHRPDVDEVHIKCPKCGEIMSRIPEVMDCWFDSGAMPFAQIHYPFENKENLDREHFPADFICEGIDQTRGWFYSLLAISTFIKGTAPYKNVLVNDLILDKEGKKMSKSQGAIRWIPSNSLTSTAQMRPGGICCIPLLPGLLPGLTRTG